MCVKKIIRTHWFSDYPKKENQENLTHFYDALEDDVKAKYADLRMNTPKRIRFKIKYQISTLRGIIKPQCTNKAYTKKEIGSTTSNHPSEQKIRSVRNKDNRQESRKRKQEELRAKHLEELQGTKYSTEKVLDKEGAEMEAESIIESKLSVFSESIINALNTDPDQRSLELTKLVRSFYIMYTGRIATIDGIEWAQFLTNRGNNVSGPVLRHTVESLLYRTEAPDESIITKCQMKDSLGFKVMPLYSSKFQVNARDVEDALQKKFQFLPLGCRLWRCVDNGLKYELPDGTDKVHTVSIVYSDEIIPMINKGLIEVCETIWSEPEM